MKEYTNGIFSSSILPSGKGQSEEQKDKASFENKLSKLLSTPYKEEAEQYIKQFNESRANYKGWEMVLEAYKSEISAIQSVIKYNLQGEINTNLANKNEVEQYY